MKRAELKRSNKPLARSAMKRRTRRGDNPRLRREWAAKQTRCAACWRPNNTGFPPFSTHHILGAENRIDHVANFLRLCGWCHGAFHGAKIPAREGYWPTLTTGMVLTLKHETEPEMFAETLAWLQEQLGNKRLPDAEVLPRAFYVFRRRKYEPTEETGE